MYHSIEHLIPFVKKNLVTTLSNRGFQPSEDTPLSPSAAGTTLESMT